MPRTARAGWISPSASRCALRVRLGEPLVRHLGSVFFAIGHLRNFPSPAEFRFFALKTDTDLLEFGGLHALAPLARSAFSIASETRRGDSGVSLKFARMSAKASATALAIAAGGAMAPPSPRPLTPYSVVSAGVSRCSMRMFGISGAHGTM